MKNLTINVTDTIVTLTFSTTANFGASSSGKSLIVSSTEGNISIPGTDLKLGLNAYKGVTK